MDEEDITESEELRIDWERLFSDDPGERFNALDESEGRPPFHLLRTLALYDPDNMVRGEAQGLAVDWYEERATEILLRAAKEDGWWPNRRDAWSLLGQVGIDRAVLDEAMNDRDLDDWERAGALLGLIHQGHDMSGELDLALNSDYNMVREMLPNSLKHMEEWPEWLGPYLLIILPPKIAREEDRLARLAKEELLARVQASGAEPETILEPCSGE